MHTYTYPNVQYADIQDLLALRAAGEQLDRPAHAKLTREAGSYLAKQKGRGMEFAESRPYQIGDDIRHLDWRVTARSGKLHSKVFQEERERPVMFALDFRGAMFFATRGAFKSVVASHAAALLAWNAHHHGDRIGGMLFNDHQHLEIKPRSGKQGILHFLHAVASYSADQQLAEPGDLLPHLLRLRQMSRPGSLIYIASDFYHADAACLLQLQQLAKHNSVIMLWVYDEFEKTLPPAAIYHVKDQQGRASFYSGDRQLQQQYAEQFQQRWQLLQDFSRHAGIALLICATHMNLQDLLQQQVRLIHG